jgi:hypothetical protein
VAGSCEHGNEPSGSIKSGNFLLAERLLSSQEGLCPMKLVAMPVCTVDVTRNEAHVKGRTISLDVTVFRP